MSVKCYVQYHINPNVRYVDGVFGRNVSFSGRYGGLVHPKGLFRFSVRAKGGVLKCGAGWCGNDVQYFMGVG